MGSQVNMEASVRILSPQPVGGVSNQRGLAHAGHSMDDGEGQRGRLRTRHRQQSRQFVLASAEVAEVPWQVVRRMSGRGAVPLRAGSLKGDVPRQDALMQPFQFRAGVGAQHLAETPSCLRVDG
ncbi:predicted protein [Streptomyces iranensis]|uniref:Uncharacterized protein n=1 Tax=Streptomyces iranensis TaxID=576784 RepID=A0A060ZR38_9ACTN|nr:predicted protein [Streptomyces iranensis]